MPDTDTKLFTATQYADLVRSRVGKKYILGQPIPYNKEDPDALDCSGLIIWANNKSGAYVSGDDTAAGLYNRSVAVVGAPTVGDMVFLRNNPARSNGIGHMAVIIGKLNNGDYRIIEARGKASGVVSTTLSYWKTRKYYTGVRRLRNFKLATEPAEPPVVTPPTVVTTKFVVGTYNCLDTRFGGKSNDDGAVVNKMAASVYLLTEAPQTVRNNVRRARGGTNRWLVWTRDDAKSQAIMFDKTKYGYKECKNVTFGPTSYHGAVIAVLTRKDSGKKVQFASFHLPPTSIYKTAEDASAARKKYFNRLIDELDPTLPTVLGGDANTTAVIEWAHARGFVPAVTGATTDKGKRLDYLLVRSGSFTNEKVIDAGKASDHKAVVATVTIADSTT